MSVDVRNPCTEGRILDRLARTLSLYTGGRVAQIGGTHDRTHSPVRSREYRRSEGTLSYCIVQPACSRRPSELEDALTRVGGGPGRASRSRPYRGASGSRVWSVSAVCPPARHAGRRSPRGHRARRRTLLQFADDRLDPRHAFAIRLRSSGLDYLNVIFNHLLLISTRP